MKKDLRKRLMIVIILISMLFANFQNSNGIIAMANTSTKDLATYYLNTTKIYLHLGGNDQNTFDFNIKKSAKEPNSTYEWGIKKDKGEPNAITINRKTGVVTAKTIGTAYIYCKIKKSDGTILTPEAAVIVRNNITKIDISNVYNHQTISVGTKLDFNNSIKNTEAGEDITSSDIIRWELKENSAGASVSSDGIVQTSKAGTFQIRALSFESSSKYNKWLKDKIQNEKYITASSNWYSINVEKNVKEAVVNTQAQLDAALTDKDITLITLSTKAEAEFKISKGDYSLKSIFVNIPNADVINEGTFKSVVIQSIKDSTWIEYANGNIIYLDDSVASIIIDKNSDIREIVIDRPDSVMNIIADGNVDKITLLENSQVSLSGSSKNVELVVEETAAGSDLSSSVPLNLEIKADIAIDLNEGAEGTKLNRTDNAVEVSVKNDTQKEVQIFTNNVAEQVVDAGTSAVSKAEPEKKPSDKPTNKPTVIPTTAAPTIVPTVEPTAAPTTVPTVEPIVVPIPVPTVEPTAAPTAIPTVEPTAAPTAIPTVEPTAAPTAVPTVEPTAAPTAIPTVEPTAAPTAVPTVEPTAAPTAVPTVEPTATPIAMPTVEPTAAPTAVPIVEPTTAPTAVPTVEPTAAPTAVPTIEPTAAPTNNPIANPDSITINEDSGTIRIEVLSNDTDIDNDILKVNKITVMPSKGKAEYDSDNIYYTPNTNEYGEDTLEYEIKDPFGVTATATVTININAVDDLPIINDDQVAEYEDELVTIDVLANDYDPEGDAFNLISCTDGTIGSAKIIDNKIVYKPNANVNGSDEFGYTIGYGENNTIKFTAKVKVTIFAVNDAPVANADNVITDEDKAITIKVIENDTDTDNDILKVNKISVMPSKGKAQYDSDNIYYTPNTNEYGEDTLEYEIIDPFGVTATAIVTININAVDDLPIIKDDEVTVDEDVQVTIDVLANDYDIEGDAFNLISCTDGTIGSAKIIDNKIVYKPNANVNGSDEFGYTIGYGENNTIKLTAKVKVTIYAVNDAPVANADNVTTDEDKAITIKVTENDTDVENDTLYPQIVKGPDCGTLSLEGNDYIYTPNSDFNGSDSFTYYVIDKENAASSVATVSITINPVNKPYQAVNDTATVESNTNISIDVISNDINIDGLTYTLLEVKMSQNATAVIDNTNNKIIYTPVAEFFGTDSFTYTVRDGDGNLSTATVTVTVKLGNPVAQPDSVTTDEDTPLLINVLENDVNKKNLTGINFSQPKYGTVIKDANNSLTYTPNPDYNGMDTFEYYILYGNGAYSKGTVTIDVKSIYDNPVAVDDKYYVLKNVEMNYPELNLPTFYYNDHVVENETYIYEYSYNSSQVQVASQGYGSKNIIITPQDSFSGVSVITYTIKVSGKPELSATAKIYVYVAPKNQTFQVSAYLFQTDMNNYGVKYEVYKSGTYQITCNSNGKNVQIFLYKEGGSTGSGNTYIGSSSNGVNPSFSEPLSTGTYYLYVKCGSTLDQTNYNVTSTYIN